MKCSFCGHTFEEDQAQRGCSGCPFKGNCKNIKCPNCGFEMPEEPAWMKKIKGWREKAHG